MIRFPNPGSDIKQLINIFRKLYANLVDFTNFDLNNIADILTQLNLASSSGYIGEEALKRSYSHSDISRNPLYNQAKMYAEIYRILGWIKSTPETTLQFNFTYLGSHVAPLENDPKELFEQSIIGIIYPNETIKVNFKDINTPFITILRAMIELDNIICRDELVIGPLNMSDSRDESDFQSMISKIRTLRSTGKKKNLLDTLDQQSKDLKIQTNTLRNYTRFIISSLEYIGWVTKGYSNIYHDGKKTGFLILTDAGRSTYEHVRNCNIIFKDEIDKDNEQLTKAISSIGFLKMLERANFDVEHTLNEHKNYLDILEKELNTSNILFSPFQFFNDADIKRFLPQYATAKPEETVTLDFIHEISESPVPNIITETNIPFSSLNKQLVSPSKKSKTEKLLISVLNEENKNIFNATKSLMLKILPMKQLDFYPLVADLFSIIGLNATAPSAGVNNERWDVIIPDDNYSIPVEVKSPTEEKVLSVKAIRQALENKIVLLSRNSYTTDFDCVTLAVGYQIPNPRSEVYKLIDEIYQTYHINIGILSIDTLLNIALYCIKDEKKYDIEMLKNARGVVVYEHVLTKI